MGGDKGGTSNLKNYYGDIGAVVCAGPVDELVAIVIDGAVIWPTNNYWADGVIDLPVATYKRSGGVAKLTFNFNHTCRESQKFTLSGMPDASFNCPAATAIISASETVIYYNNPGPDVPQTTAAQNTGVLTKSVHYLVGAMVMYLGAFWTASAAHDGTPGNAPPDAAHWTEFHALRATSPNPLPITVAGNNSASGARFNYGQGFFYWGTNTQTLDPSSTLLKFGHPPYRNQALLELRKFYLGTQLQNAPNVEVIVRKTPAQTVIAGASAALDADSQANPLAVAASMLQDPIFGLGQNAALCDAATWQALADALAAVASNSYISVVLDTDLTFRQFLAQLLTYYDGWLRFNGSGAIEAGRFLHNAAPPAFDPTTTINWDVMIQGEEIKWDANGYADTANETVVKFKDRERAFKDAGQQYVSSLNRQIVGEPRKAALDRPWITREQQASNYAAEYGKIGAQPKLGGSLVVRRERAAAIRAGDLFLLTNDLLAYSVICRCISRALAAPPAGRATLKFENERGAAPIPFHPTPPAPPLRTIATNELVSLYQIVQTPPLLAGDDDFYVTVLAARKSVTTQGLRLWMKQADTGVFYELGSQTGFAVQGTLAQNFGITYGQTFNLSTHLRNLGNSFLNIYSPAPLNIPGGVTFDVDDQTDPSFNATGIPLGVYTITGPPTWVYSFTYAQPGQPNVDDGHGGTVACTGTVTVAPQDDLTENLQLNLSEFTVQADLDRISATQSADAVNDNALLVFLVSAANPAQFEICTVIALRLDSGVYKLKVRRAQFGTTQTAFVTGDEAWIIYRSDLVNYTQAQFNQYAQSALPVDFRLQSFSDRGEADVGDTTVCPDVNFTFEDPFAISVTWTGTMKKAATDSDFVASTFAWLPNGAVAGGGVSFAAGTQFKFSAEISSVAGTLTDAHMVARMGSRDYVVWSQNFPPTNLQLVTATFTLNDPGVYRLFLVARDQQSRTAEVELPVFHDTVDHETVIKISSPTEMPTATPGGRGYGWSAVLAGVDISLTTGTAGATISYQLLARGVAVGATWKTYSTPIHLSRSMLLAGKTLYAKATSGGTDSPIVRNDYWLSRR